ncbi:MAG TPA: hydroxymethylpyrimidine/phosphomethylpyrimidine kinase [Solirubrobacteraceae bacterium]|nr:hydroxymethylpyrimidine/phosphomethylpyrimidine kinase [Solirubrobacteraceae bacterium]
MAGSSQAPPVALSIAGLDPSGGAGVLADIKAFSRCSVYGACALTAVTVQNTVAVRCIRPLAPALVRAQAEAVIEDLAPAAIKIGMLASAPIARTVGQLLAQLPADVAVVVDPVLRSSSGTRLLSSAGLRALIEEILPRATVITPNHAEARALLQAAHGAAVAEQGSPQALLEALLALGPAAVVLTGGDLAAQGAPAGRVHDHFLSAEPGARMVTLSGARRQPASGHGSGCTHSALIAAQLAAGSQPLAAARRARAASAAAIAAGARAALGRGAPPVDVLGLVRRRGGAAAAKLPGDAFPAP